MKVGVIGTGHVGLVTCVTLAHIGHDVCGVDSDEEKIAQVKDGSVPFFEPGLSELLAAERESGRLSFSAEVADAVAGADVVFICVGTPPREGGAANLAAVERAAREVAGHVTGRCLIVEKSTVPTGTAQKMRETIARANPSRATDLEIVSNPEFLREGGAVKDALHPDRILVGAETSSARAQMRELYAPLLEQGVALYETDIATAELAKHASNAFLALKISFANAMAQLCERSGADVVAVADLMGADPRIGRQFLDAGIGYGGFCFPKDLAAFDRLSTELGYDFALLREISRINEGALELVLSKVQDALWNVEGKRVALLGLSYKPDTDDVRFSPSLALAAKLLELGARVVGYDPIAGSNAKSEVPGLHVAPDVYEAAAGAHCLVLCTEWEEFRDVDLARLKEAMAEAVVVDGRNLFDPEAMNAAGFTYIPTGRPRSAHP